MSTRLTTAALLEAEAEKWRKHELWVSRMAKEAAERAATATLTERHIPTQGAQAEEGPGDRQESKHEGGPDPPPSHHGTPHTCSQEERDKIWWEGYEAARSEVAQVLLEARARS
eukprot:5874149-Heterocapsa_arctica.AAC.1